MNASTHRAADQDAKITRTDAVEVPPNAAIRPAAWKYARKIQENRIDPDALARQRDPANVRGGYLERPQ